mgnify:FL=1
MKKVLIVVFFAVVALGMFAAFQRPTKSYVVIRVESDQAAFYFTERGEKVKCSGIQAALNRLSEEGYAIRVAEEIRDINNGNGIIIMEK